MSKNSKSEGQKKLKNKEYLKELRKLQGELCKLQEWIKHEGLRVIIIFEGRDAAGKGGTIKAITERVSPPRLSLGCAAGAIGPRDLADVFPTLHAAFPSRG